MEVAMESISKEQFGKVIKALTSAYYAKEKTEVGELWQARVMGNVLSMGPIYSKTGYFELFQQFVWRLTPVTFILVGLLSLALIKMDFFSDYEFTKAFVSNSTDLVTLAMYSGS
jgi:hypothetical protein